MNIKHEKPCLFTMLNELDGVDTELIISQRAVFLDLKYGVRKLQIAGDLVNRIETQREILKMGDLLLHEFRDHVFYPTLVDVLNKVEDYV